MILLQRYLQNELHSAMTSRSWALKVACSIMLHPDHDHANFDLMVGEFYTIYQEKILWLSVRALSADEKLAGLAVLELQSINRNSTTNRCCQCRGRVKPCEQRLSPIYALDFSKHQECAVDNFVRGEALMALRVFGHITVSIECCEHFAFATWQSLLILYISPQICHAGFSIHFVKYKCASLLLWR